jgi:hypothetical protein
LYNGAGHDGMEDLVRVSRFALLLSLLFPLTSLVQVPLPSPGDPAALRQDITRLEATIQGGPHTLAAHIEANTRATKWGYMLCQDLTPIFPLEVMLVQQGGVMQKAIG